MYRAVLCDLALTKLLGSTLCVFALVGDGVVNSSQANFQTIKQFTAQSSLGLRKCKVSKFST